MKKAQGVPDCAAALVVGLMVLGFGYFVLRADAPSKQAAVVSPIESAIAQQEAEPDNHFMERIRKSARQTNGDWTRLSMSDQHTLDGHTGGHGRAMFTMMAKEIAEGKSVAPPPSPSHPPIKKNIRWSVGSLTSFRAAC